MKNRLRSYGFTFVYFSSLLFRPELGAGQSTGFRGQAIGWGAVNPVRPFQVQGGLRYIPEFSFSRPAGKYSFEGEFSVNTWGSVSSVGGDSTGCDGELSPYRMWVKLSGDQFELRAGLQKINFGSAMLFRPLMWFDRIDPRDPLQLTDGVYGLLGRYYFLNNVNIWIWGLYGDDKTKGWEIFPSKKNSIEFGGRLQAPVHTGEMAFSYHHRTADPGDVMPDSLVKGKTVPENRIALDAKFDLGVGFWIEAAVIHQALDYSALKYTSMLNAGIDYTFGLGNGLNLAAETFGYLKGKHVLGAGENLFFGLLSARYPVSIIHNLSAILFIDFTNQDLYRFVNWSITYDKWSFYLMGFWNPGKYQLYNFGRTTSLFSGWGFQVMAVFNH